MNIQSMTGFGKSEKIDKEFYAQVTIKSVNNRYLDIQIKCPKSLMSLESKLRGILEKYISRGSVICFIQYESFSGKSSHLKLNKAVLNEYKNVIQELKNTLGESKTLDISELLNIPELIIPVPEGIQVDQLETQIVPVFTEACEAFTVMRTEEGERLIQDIKKRAKSFSSWIKELNKLIPGRQKNYLKKMRLRVEELIGTNGNIDEDRILTELGIMAEKLDVTEEVVRFESHIQLFLETLKKSKTPGKKLGFILQEMLREVNTLSTKGQCIDIQHRCVAMKENIEIIREQIQNIE